VGALFWWTVSIVRTGSSKLLTAGEERPRMLAMKLDRVIANVAVLPFNLKESRSSKVRDRRRELVKRLHAAGLIRAEGGGGALTSTRKYASST
jgi:hypothetical protein